MPATRRPKNHDNSTQIEFHLRIPHDSDHRFLIWLLRVVLLIAGSVYAGKEIWKILSG